MEQPSYQTSVAGKAATGSEARPAPGPWHVSSYEGGWDCVRDSHEQVICKLVLNEPTNARLIAAAPELLAALQLLIEAPTFEAYREQARAAIRAATGEA